MPRGIITDTLKSYGAAKKEILKEVEHRQHKGFNNRVENSHQPPLRQPRQWADLERSPLWCTARCSCSNLAPKSTRSGLRSWRRRSPAWSHDGGKTWQAADTGRNQDYTWGLIVDPEVSDCWYISASMEPMEAHRDDLKAEAYIYRWQRQGPWEALDEGLPQPLDSHPYGLASISGSLYAGHGNGRIYRSEDGRDTWQQLNLQGDPLSRVLALVGTA